MVGDSATLLLVAIRSGIRLSGQIRLAHVDATRRRELLLPLPRFETRTDWREAVEFFTNPGLGRAYTTGQPHLTRLLAKAHDATLSPEEQVELSHLHAEYAYLKTAEELGQEWTDGTRVDPEELAALFAVRQWQRRSLDPSPTVLQRMAGVLWEMGVDYASHQPDPFQLHGPLPRNLLAFFRGLDQSSDLPDPWLSELVPRLFRALSQQDSTPRSDGGGLRGPETLQQLTSSILDVVTRHLSSARTRDTTPIEDLATRDRIADWGEHLMRTALHWIMGDASSGSAESPILRTTLDIWGMPRVAADLLEAVVSDPIRFDQTLGSGSLAPLLSAGIRLVGEHPSLSEEGSTGIPELLHHLTELLEAHPHRRFPRLLPELGERILSHAAEDPVRLWPIQGSTSPASPLIAVTKQILAGVFQDPSDASLHPGFRPSDLVAIVDQVLTRCVESPDVWLQPEGTPAATLQVGIQRWLTLLAKPRRGRPSPAQALRVLEDVLDTLDGRKASARPRSRRTKSHRPSAPPRPPRKGKAAP